MGKRHREALWIQQGACNPSGIARAAVTAIDEARAENAVASEDAAVRLIVHQLAFICGVPAIDSGNLDVYRGLMQECEEREGT